MTNPRELMPRFLMGPGPSDVAPSVLNAIRQPVIGHLDPQFVRIMDDVQGMLRSLFRTENKMTLPISGTGSAGMETCFVNLLEPGDTAIIGVNGVFGTRMVDVATRCGAEVFKLEAPWGEIIPVDKMVEAIEEIKPKVVGLVHAETSTGVHQPVSIIAKAARKVGALMILDTVTSLGGMPVDVDAWGVDAAYSGTQKCLSCPPGLAPVTFSDRAMDVVLNRNTLVQSWYLDLTMLGSYWGGSRTYHHTAPISMIYALHEALREVFVEGLETRFIRHRFLSKRLVEGLEALGFELSAQEGHRLPMLLAVTPPEGVDGEKLKADLLQYHNIEIGGGLGPMKGKILRVGLMGESCCAGNVYVLLSALSRLLGKDAFDKPDKQ